MENIKKQISLIIFLILFFNSNAQNSESKMQTKILKTKTLEVKPSSTSSETDFDFLQGADDTPEPVIY